jgi:hypothetical protein
MDTSFRSIPEKRSLMPCFWESLVSLPPCTGSKRHAGKVFFGLNLEEASESAEAHSRSKTIFCRWPNFQQTHMISEP